MYQKKVVVRNRSGLHARPANQFIKAAIPFKSELLIESGGKRYNAKSIISILQACIQCGTEITIIANGDDEQDAVKSLCAAVASGLGEE